MRRFFALQSLVLLTACAGPQVAPTARAARAQSLELRFLDVGQADAILIRHAGKTALVDAGSSDDIAERLGALGVDTIDLLVASHNHTDHIGGADAVLRRFPVRRYLDNGIPATTAAYEGIVGLLGETGVVYLKPLARSFIIGDATIRIIPPAPGIGGDDQNNHSLAVLLGRGSFRALMTGDSEVELINALLASEDLPDVDVLKAAHHGSRNGVSPAWLARLRPEVVVISVGAGNSYGHPDPWALRYYESGGRIVLRTDRDGDVVITVAADGAYSITTPYREN